jgi:hypothetical protein
MTGVLEPDVPPTVILEVETLYQPSVFVRVVV